MTRPKITALLQLWPQWVAALTVTLLCVSFGLVVGWTSPYLAILTRENAVLRVTADEAAWIASLMPFGRFFGAIAGSTILEYFGSKMSLLCAGVPVMIGWICIIFANSATWLYISRICSGISLGMFFSSFAIYVGEIAAPKIRGALVSMIINGMPLGTLFGNILGTQVSMMWFGVISLIPSFIYLLIIPFLPDSPHYHIRNNNLDKAKQALQWYNRKPDVTADLEDAVNFIRSSDNVNFCEKLKLIVEKKNRRAFTMIIMLYIFMQLSGLNTLSFYMEMILIEAKVTSIEPSIVVILCSGTTIIIGWIGMYLIDRCGRKLLIVISSCFIIVVMALLAIHFMLLEQHFDPESIDWIPILAMMLFTMMSIGLIPVPSTILGELFQANLKSIAGFTVSVTAAILAFISSRTYQPLVDLITTKCVFLLYMILMIICVVYSVAAIPETKGKTLQEIQDMLTGDKKREGSDEKSRTSKTNVILTVNDLENHR